MYIYIYICKKYVKFRSLIEIDFFVFVVLLNEHKF